MRCVVQYVVSAPPLGEVARGALLPLCEGCGTAELLQIISLIGAIIAPHNLYLHSALVKVTISIEILRNLPKFRWA